MPAYRASPEEGAALWAGPGALGCIPLHGTSSRYWVIPQSFLHKRLCPFCPCTGHSSPQSLSLTVPAKSQTAREDALALGGTLGPLLVYLLIALFQESSKFQGFCVVQDL